MNVSRDSKPRLMVVDDESDNLDLLYRTFRREFQVFTASSAFQALDVLNREAEMAIIISDQRMPKMSGTELLSITAERYPDTIRILLTAYTDVEDLVGAINTGQVFKYITKPWNPDELRQIVYQAAETYQVLKQRTNELHRALRRESLFSLVTTTIRGSLDYHSMLTTMVETIGQAFDTECCLLRAIEPTTPYNTAQLQFSTPVLIYPDPKNSGAIAPAPGAEVDWSDLQIDLAKRFDLANQLETPASTSRGWVMDLAPHRLLLPLVYQETWQAMMVLIRPEGETWSAEELELLEQVGNQAALALSQARLYQQIQFQTEQMRAELALARQIQSNLLRQHWTNPDNLKIQAVCRPAREIGGDFFEVYIQPSYGDVWLAVGDVSGKGVPAALFMTSALSTLRRELSQEILGHPTEILQNLNRTLFADLVNSNCFITMVLICYTPATQTLTYANAGHIYPLVWSKSGINSIDADIPDQPDLPPQYLAPRCLRERSVPLGILHHWSAPLGQIALRSGDVLLLSSDGVTEATVYSASSTEPPLSTGMLQQRGLWNLLKQQGESIDLTDVLAQIQAYNPVQEDDQTLLSLEVL